MIDTIIRRLRDGEKPAAIAESLGCSRHFVYHVERVAKSPNKPVKIQVSGDVGRWINDEAWKAGVSVPTFIKGLITDAMAGSARGETYVPNR